MLLSLLHIKLDRKFYYWLAMQFNEYEGCTGIIKSIGGMQWFIWPTNTPQSVIKLLYMPWDPDFKHTKCNPASKCSFFQKSVGNWVIVHEEEY